jgi:hypothetical protein
VSRYSRAGPNTIVTLDFLHRPTRKFARAATAALLLAGMLGSVLAYHNHSILAPDTELAAPDADQFVTRHDPLSRAAHCHAVIAVVHEQDCVACHAQRLPGALAQSHQSEPASSVRTGFVPRPERKLAASLPTSGSRAPPVLL